MDDFAIFGEALTSSQISKISGGNPILTLNDPNLLAYWGFEDVGPAFITSRIPAPSSTGIAASGPGSHVIATMVDGSTTATAFASRAKPFSRSSAPKWEVEKAAERAKRQRLP